MSPEDRFDDLTTTIETSEGDSEVALVVRSISGRKLTPGEFVAEVEHWLYEIQTALALKQNSGAKDH